MGREQTTPLKKKERDPKNHNHDSSTKKHLKRLVQQLYRSEKLQHRNPRAKKLSLLKNDTTSAENEKNEQELSYKKYVSFLESAQQLNLTELIQHGSVRFMEMEEAPHQPEGRETCNHGEEDKHSRSSQLSKVNHAPTTFFLESAKSLKTNDFLKIPFAELGKTMEAFVEAEASLNDGEKTICPIAPDPHSEEEISEHESEQTESVQTEQKNSPQYSKTPSGTNNNEMPRPNKLEVGKIFAQDENNNEICKLCSKSFLCDDSSNNNGRVDHLQTVHGMLPDGSFHDKQKIVSDCFTLNGKDSDENLEYICKLCPFELKSLSKDFHDRIQHIQSKHGISLAEKKCISRISENDHLSARVVENSDFDILDGEETNSTKPKTSLNEEQLSAAILGSSDSFLPDGKDKEHLKCDTQPDTQLQSNLGGTSSKKNNAEKMGLAEKIVGCAYTISSLTVQVYRCKYCSKRILTMEPPLQIGFEHIQSEHPDIFHLLRKICIEGTDSATNLKLLDFFSETDSGANKKQLGTCDTSENTVFI